MTVVITPGRRAATAATIRVRRLFECGDYSSAASDQANTVCAASQFLSTDCGTVLNNTSTGPMQP